MYSICEIEPGQSFVMTSLWLLPVCELYECMLSKTVIYLQCGHILSAYPCSEFDHNSGIINTLPCQNCLHANKLNWFIPSFRLFCAVPADTADWSSFWCRSGSQCLWLCQTEQQRKDLSLKFSYRCLGKFIGIVKPLKICSSLRAILRTIIARKSIFCDTLSL